MSKTILHPLMLVVTVVAAALFLSGCGGDSIEQNDDLTLLGFRVS